MCCFLVYYYLAGDVMSIKHRNRLPLHIANVFGTSRKFKQFQRKNIRDIQRMVSNDLRRGCAYFPVSGTKKVDQINQLLDELREELSVEQWGR